jgi:hypothetical protein
VLSREVRSKAGSRTGNDSASSRVTVPKITMSEAATESILLLRSSTSGAVGRSVAASWPAAETLGKEASVPLPSCTSCWLVLHVPSGKLLVALEGCLLMLLSVPAAASVASAPCPLPCELVCDIHLLGSGCCLGMDMPELPAWVAGEPALLLLCSSLKASCRTDRLPCTSAGSGMPCAGKLPLLTALLLKLSAVLPDVAGPEPAPCPICIHGASLPPGAWCSRTGEVMADSSWRTPTPVACGAVSSSWPS